MLKLGSRDVELLLAELPHLYALCPRDQLPGRALRTAHKLIGCDGASFNEIELATGEFRVLMDPDDSSRTALTQTFSRHMHQHPVIRHHAASGDLRACAISDLMCGRAFRRLPLHGEFFGPLGITDQLSTALEVMPRRLVVGLAVDRAAPFNERDRLLLDALRPHLVTTYRNSIRYSDALSDTHSDAQLAERAAQAIPCLTPRQLEVLGHLAGGCTNAQIALILDVSVKTVSKHVEHILQRLGVRTRVGAARMYLAGPPCKPPRPWWSTTGAAQQPLPTVP